MNATFRLDGLTTLRIGNDLELPNQSQPRGYIAMLLEKEPMYPPQVADGPVQTVLPTKVTTLGIFTPSQARAVASVLLSAATEGR